ncbi:MAG: TRAP transporter small permease [Lautropia sp.]
MNTGHPSGHGGFDRWSMAYLLASAKLVRAVGALALVVMVGSHALEIVWRQVNGRGLSWVHEFSIIVAMLLYFFMYAEVSKTRDYVRLELLEQHLSPRSAAALAGVIRVLVLGFHLLVAWFAFESVRFAANFETTVLGWPETVYVLPLAVGCTDIAVTEAIHLARHLLGLPQPRRLGPRVLT